MSAATAFDPPKFTSAFMAARCNSMSLASSVFVMTGNARSDFDAPKASTMASATEHFSLGKALSNAFTARGFWKAPKALAAATRIAGSESFRNREDIFS